MNVFDFHDIDFTVSSIVSVFLNGIILYMILIRNVLGNNSYNGVLAQSTIINIASSLPLFYIKPCAILYNGSTFILFPTSNSVIIRGTYIFFAHVWTAAFYLTFINSANGFLYRYRSICLGHDYTSQYAIVSTVVSVTSASIISLVVYLCLYIIDDDTLAARSKVVMDMVGNRRLGSIHVVGSSIGGTLSAYGMMVSGIVPSMAVYGIIFYTYLKVRTFLKENHAALSKRTLSLHRQYTKVVIIQTLMPFISFIIPITFMTFTLYLNNVDTVVISVIGIQGLAWIPVGNALTVILSVKPLHQHLFCKTSKFFKKMLNRKVTTTTLTNEHGHAPTNITNGVNPRPYILPVPATHRAKRPLFARNHINKK